MLYIVSGIAKSGKTTLTEWMLKDFGIASFSTDYLMMALAKGNPACGVDEREDDKVVAASLEPYLEAMIQVMIYNRANYIIEGVHFNPAFLSRLMRTYPDQLRAIYLGYAHVELEEKLNELLHYRQHVPTVWFATHSLSDMRTLVGYLIQESQRLETSAHRYHIPYLDIVNLQRQKDDCYRLLGLKINKPI